MATMTPTTADAISTLYSNIRFAAEDQPIRSVVITSATAGEGKTFVALHLATAMAQSGKKTLLVDANFHAPALAAQLGVGDAKGLAEVADGLSLSDAVSPTSVDGLFYLGNGKGTPVPADLFGTMACADALKKATFAYDYVVIDTPALDPYIDAAVLASQADATVLVVCHHGVPRDAVKAASDQLTKAHARVIGVVMNRCED